MFVIALEMVGHVNIRIISLCILILIGCSRCNQEYRQLIG